MGNEEQQEPQNPRAYFIIRDLAAGLVGVLDQVRFEPMFQRHPETLSVVALMPGDYLAGYKDICLTLWRGRREGPGGNGNDQGLWLRIDQQDDFEPGDGIQPVDPGKAGLGLTLPSAGSQDGTLRAGITGMLGLLLAAIPVHREADKDLAFGALNHTIEEGFEGSGQGLHDELDELGEAGGPVADLEQLCADSDLESVEFGPYGSGAGWFGTRTFLDAAEQLAMTVWSAVDGTNWIDIAGKVQLMNAPELVFPGEDQDEADEVAELAEQLAEIHEVASSIVEDLGSADTDTAFDLLNAVAYGAMNGSPEARGPYVRSWHRMADRFVEHCRLGFLAGVMLEESPFGNLNIRASTIDPVTRTTTDLQVYWSQDEEHDEAEHWLSVGTLTGPAHDVDLDYPELLAGTPEASREHILHAVGHLHEMVHLAGSILEARTLEALSFLDLKRAEEDIPDAVEHEMVRTAIEDTLTGLNGVARLYTGAMAA